jgi:hypothetical protein
MYTYRGLKKIQKVETRKGVHICRGPEREETAYIGRGLGQCM